MAGMLSSQKKRNMPKAIGYYYVVVTHPGLRPHFIKCISTDDALQLAREDIAAGYDPYECSCGCLTVFDDGSVSHVEFTVDELKGE